MSLCVCVCSLIVIFFFKPKTAYDMRISDWSSDVCSSDLHRVLRLDDFHLHPADQRAYPDRHAAYPADADAGLHSDHLILRAVSAAVAAPGPERSEDRR